MTFSEWYEKFQQDYYHGKYKHQRYGQAFSDALHFSNKSHLSNALIFTNHDPFYSDTIAPEALDFVARNW